MNTRLGLVAAIGLSLLAFFAACHGASARQFRVLYSFCAQANCADGAIPNSGLIADGNGNLYGTAEGGAGVVFELVRGEHGSWLYQVLHSFCSAKDCDDGFDPRGRLIMDTAGNLFGTTIGQGSFLQLRPSTIFELSPDQTHTHWTFKTLYNFCLLNWKDHPCRHRSSYATSALTYAGQASGAQYDGKSPLYGYGQDVYHKRQTEFVYSYTGSDSIRRVAKTSDIRFAGDPLIGNDGLLYGVASSDQSKEQGTVFAVNTNTHRWATLHEFCAQPNCDDGGWPSGGLMFDAAGNLYGNAIIGSPTSYCLDAGFSYCGIIYRLTPQNGQYKYSVLHDLCGKPNCSDGAQPTSSLIMDTTGTLYGIAPSGGWNAGIGTVFEANDTLRAIHHFCHEANCSDGAYPSGPLLMDAKGNLFGTTSEGGAHFDPPNVLGGTIFEITN